jgi:two-component system, OmpR family, sensor histidine kinase TctE
VRLRARSLRQRLLAALLLVWALGAAAMAAYFQIQAVTPEEVLEGASLATQARALESGLRFTRAGQLAAVEIPARWRAVYAAPNGGYYTLFDPAGRVAARSANLAAPLPLAPLEPLERVSPLRLIGQTQMLAVTAKAPHGYRLVVARANPSLVDETPGQQMQDLTPGMIFGLAALIGLVAAWLVAAWSLRPLKRAAAEAAAIGPENPLRLSVDSLPTEVQRLAKAVNQALDRVAEAYGAEKRFTAEAAHALRTPLAVLDLRLQRAEADGAVDWPAVRADLAELTRVVAGLLALARADRVDALRRVDDINLSRLVREAAAALAPAIEARGRSIEVVAPKDPLILRGDRGALYETVVALIDNALVHGEGRILAELASEQGPAARLRVSDQGEGVRPDAREAVFERFHKCDAASAGAGLGLAIVRQTARGHGGEAAFAAAASVELRLPL